MADFDPEGEGYDEASATAAGLGPDATGHWPSRVPDTGLILKGRRHPTYNLTEQGEAAAGYQIHRGKEGRYYSIQAPQDGEPPIRSEDVDLPERMERQAFGFLDSLLRKDPKPKPVEPSPTMAQYPSDEDVEFAKTHGFGYGSIAEPYINQQTANVLGEVRMMPAPVQPKSKTVQPPLMVFTARSAAGMYETEILNAVNDSSRNINVDLTDPANRAIRNRLGHTYAKAALAVAANPVAQLGFDPKRIMLDVKLGESEGGTVNIGGLYGKKQDAIYANLAGPGSVVHESIHRGFKLLRDRAAARGIWEGFEPRPELAKLMAEMPAEELVTRYMMVKYAGDVEASTGEAGLAQRNEAIQAFGKTFLGSERVKRIEAVMREAQKLVAEKRPGGPR